MATERFTGAQTDARNSTVDMTGKEFHFAKRVAGGFALCGAGEQPSGVISEGKKVGLRTSIKTGNQLKVMAGAAINPGAKIMSNADSEAVTATATNYVYGKYMGEAACADGDLITIDVTNEGILAA